MLGNASAGWWEDLDREVLDYLAVVRRATPRDLGARLGMSERAAVSLVSQLAVAGRVNIVLVEPHDDLDPPRTPDANGVVETLFDLFATRGSARYDEDVTQLEHALQAAALARDDAAPPELVAAALLHDVGHLLLDEHAERPAFLDGDAEHERAGARFLARWLPAAVTGPVALHVVAKRYLVATDAAYAEVLSAASRRSLAVQGGPLDATGIAAFRASPWAEAALRLRRWDDAAKVAGRAVPPLEHFGDLVRALVRSSR